MSKQIRKMKIPQGILRSQIDPESSSLNEEERTVELTWTTGSKGLRRGFSGDYYEELDLSESSVDMSRLESGAPLLASHNSYDLSSVIGVVERAWIEDGKGKAKVRFSSDPDADRIFQKVKEKILRNVSVGYDVRKYTNVSEKDDEIPTYRATDWQPMEISIVPIGFDQRAQIRSQEEIINNEVEVVEPASLTISEESPMSETKDQPVLSEADIKAASERAAKEERQRGLEIRQAVASAKLDPKFAEEQIQKGTSADEVRKMVIAELAKREEKPIDNTPRVDVVADDKDKKRDAIESALLNRVDGKSFQLTDGANEFRGMSLVRIGETLLGGRKGMTDVEIAKRAMTSSDLPLILSNVASKFLQQRYETAPDTYSAWTKEKKVNDFKQHSQMKVGDFPSLSERNEEGEYTQGSISESRELIQLKQYGKILAFSERMLINDDLGALSVFVSQAGVAAKRLEASLVYSVLSSNPNMADGNPLFDGFHGNLGTNGAPSETTFDEAMQLFKAQMTIDGLDYLDLSPKYAICGPLVETAFRKFLSQVVAAQTSNVNIFANSVQLIVDPRIGNKNWFLVADPSQIDTVTLLRMNGREMPRVETRNRWETDAFEIKISHIVAAGALEHRGMVKNPYA